MKSAESKTPKIVNVTSATESAIDDDAPNG